METLFNDITEPDVAAANFEEKADEDEPGKDKSLLDVVNILPHFDVSSEEEAMVSAKVLSDVDRFENLTVSDVYHELSAAMKILQSINSTCFSINIKDCCGGGSDARKRCLALTLEALAGVDLSHWSQGPYWALGHGNLMLQPHGLQLVPVPMVESFLDGCYVLFKAKHFRGLKILISQNIRVLTNNHQKFHISRREHAAFFLDPELEAFKLLSTLDVSTWPRSRRDEADRLGGMEEMEVDETNAAADEVEAHQSQTDVAAAVAVETESTESAGEVTRVVSDPRDEETPPNLFYKKDKVQTLTAVDESFHYDWFSLNCFRKYSYLSNFIDGTFAQADNSKLHYFRAGNDRIVLKVFSPMMENAKRAPDVCRHMEELNYVSIAKPIHLAVNDRYELIGYIRKKVENPTAFSDLDHNSFDMANFIGQLTRIVEYSFRAGIVPLFTLADIVVTFPQHHVIWVNCENSRRVNDNNEKDDSDVESVALGQMVLFLQKFKDHPQYETFMTRDDQLREDFLSFDDLHSKCLQLSETFETFVKNYKRYSGACVFNDDGIKIDAAVELPNRTTQDEAPKNDTQDENDCSESEADDTKEDVDGEEPKEKIYPYGIVNFGKEQIRQTTFFKSCASSYKTPCRGYKQRRDVCHHLPQALSLKPKGSTPI